MKLVEYILKILIATVQSKFYHPLTVFDLDLKISFEITKKWVYIMAYLCRR